MPQVGSRHLFSLSQFKELTVEPALPLVPSLELFSSCFIHDSLFYLILFYSLPFIIILWKPICFLMRQRSSEPGGEGETERNRGRENIIRIYYVRGRKMSIFNKNGGVESRKWLFVHCGLIGKKDKEIQ